MISETIDASTMPTPSHRRPSFHRRILPWIYIAAFFVIAPAVIFYTSGYRYNTKKGKIERFGTLIVDSTPTGATLTLDGQLTTNSTPITLQTVPPGIHTLSLSKDGYHGWQKSLELSAERATFASDLWLWKLSDPVLRFTEPTQAISASPDGTSVIRVSVSTSTRIIASDPIGASQIAFTISQPLRLPLNWTWSDDDKHVLVESATSTWVLDLQTRQQPLLLPAGTYRWSSNAITGTDGVKRTTIALPQFSVTQAPLKNGTLDMTDANDTLRTATSTRNRVFVSHAEPSEGLVLPPGSWTFWRSAPNLMTFRDGTHWLSVLTSAQPPQSHSVDGATPLQIPGTTAPPYLLLNNGELWTWNPNEDPELVYRQSDPIVAATWHHAGHDIFFATTHDVYALNLDPRDGRLQTHLASFDVITDLTVAGKELFILGTKNAQSGVWALKVE